MYFAITNISIPGGSNIHRITKTSSILYVRSDITQFRKTCLAPIRIWRGRWHGNSSWWSLFRARPFWIVLEGLLRAARTTESSWEAAARAVEPWHKGSVSKICNADCSALYAGVFWTRWSTRLHPYSLLIQKRAGSNLQHPRRLLRSSLLVGIPLLLKK